MSERSDLKPVIKQLVRIFRKEGINYLQSKYIFKEVRRELDLAAPKKRGAGTVKRLSLKEREALINAAFEKSSLVGLMVQTLHETAARVHEFTALDADDIFLDELRIIIREGKGDKRREVPVEEHLSRSLQIHLNGREHGPLFKSQRGKRFTDRRIQQIISELARDAGILKEVTPHSLRHTRLTELAEEGMAVEQLRKFAGHEKIETTQIYIRTAALDMDGAFRKATSKI